MRRNNCATLFKVVDGLELIRDERKRLEGIVASKEFKGNRNWQWMLEWLKKSDEEHLTESMQIKNYTKDAGDEVEDDPAQDYVECGYVCQICYTPQRYLMNTTFSFCDEYGCGMNICKKCGLKIGKLAKSMPKGGND
ncbi:MAG: hypothetical protein AB9917_02095 [Negativicutes bacterium]